MYVCTNVGQLLTFCKNNRLWFTTHGGPIMHLDIDYCPLPMLGGYLGEYWLSTRFPGKISMNVPGGYKIGK